MITSMAEFAKNSPFVESNNKNNKQANITKISNNYDLHLTVHIFMKYFLWNWKSENVDARDVQGNINAYSSLTLLDGEVVKLQTDSILHEGGCWEVLALVHDRLGW